MAQFSLIINTILHGVSLLFLNPIFYLGIIFLFLLSIHKIKIERLLYGVRLHSIWQEMGRVLLFGLIAGILISVLLYFLPITIQPLELTVIWITTLILAFFRLRFFCLSYSAGLISLVTIILGTVSNNFSGQNLLFWQFIEQFHVFSWLFLANIFHLAEAFLILSLEKEGLPLFINGKRGKVIGAFLLQGFWLIPIFYFFAGVLIPLPVIIGYNDLAINSTPKEKLRFSSLLMLSISILNIGLLGISFLLPDNLGTLIEFFTSILTISTHEIMIYLINRRERTREPLFLNSQTGLKVFTVIPDSFAHRVGIKGNEVIIKVNNLQVQTKEDFYQALQLQSAFVKLEIRDTKGEVRFINQPFYKGEHHQLGIILVPDDSSPYVLEMENLSLWQLLKRKVKRERKSYNIDLT